MIQSSSPIQSVNNVVSEIVGQEMPPAVHIALRALRIYHEIWWVYQKQKVYRDPNQWVYLCAGYLLNQTLGKYEAVKKTFQIYTIALRVYDLIQELDSLNQTWVELCRAISNQYPMMHEANWKKGHTPRNIYQDRLERIMRCTGNLLVALGNVSARCIEVYNAFYIENNHEIVIDIIRGIAEVQKRKESLQLIMIKITQKITPFISDSLKGEDVIASIDDLFAKSSRIQGIVENLSKKSTVLIEDLLDGYSHTTNMFSGFHSPTPPKQAVLHVEHLQK